MSNSKAIASTGNILKWLCSLFLLFDAVMKIIKNSRYVEGTKGLGLPESSVQVLGVYLLLSTLLYIYPRTAILGGLLVTAYLGGAVAITYRLQNGGHPYLFPLVFTIVIWIAEYLRNERMRTVLPLRKSDQ